MRARRAPPQSLGQHRQHGPPAEGTYVLAPEPCGTRLTLTHAGLSDPDTRARTGAGWPS